MGTTLLERELKRGSTEVLILALLDERQRHGYDISRLIGERSGGAITFHTASLYPTLYRLEGQRADRRSMGGTPRAAAMAVLPDHCGRPQGARAAAKHLGHLLPGAGS